jgi:non-ribosomal peptide synthetase component E (peptide arylation enzyme)
MENSIKTITCQNHNSYAIHKMSLYMAEAGHFLCSVDEDGSPEMAFRGKISEKGYVTLAGRIKEMINRGGESISATEIEKLISSHPDRSAHAFPQP